MEKVMKKIWIIALGVISFTTLTTASDYFTSLASRTKNILCAAGRGLKHFYFPDYGNPSYEDSLSSDSNPVSTPSLSKVSDAEECHLYWSKKDLHNNKVYWNKKALRRWAPASYKEGKAPLEDESYSFDSESDEELMTYGKNSEKIFVPIREKNISQSHQVYSSTITKSDKITFFSI
jgi:hypothetical protein